MRDTDACDDCVVSVILGVSPVKVDDAELAALDNLAAQGLCPPLRLVPKAG